MQNMKDEIEKLSNDNFYPIAESENLQHDIYKKREFQYYKIPELINFYDEKDVENYIKKECWSFTIPKLRYQQILLTNFINPLTPYYGLLMFHGVGTGKTTSCISIAENFKEMVVKYNTKIHILVPGPLIKEHWRKEIIMMTGYKYH